MFKLAAAVAATVFAATGASAITVDGLLDAGYGAPTSTVTKDAAQASYDFSAPTRYSEQTGYSIYLTSDANSVFGYIKADTTGAGAFANLYFDLDPAAMNGSDLGFEIANDRAFIPGRDGYAANLAGLNFAISSDNTAIEFSIDNSLFTSRIAGLNYYEPQGFPSNGDAVVLRLSQSFNYTVAGGASYGATRLGAATIGGASAVPEPATWAMLIGGFGVMGGAMRGRRAGKLVAA